MMIRTFAGSGPWTYPAPKNPEHHARNLLSEWQHIASVQLVNEAGVVLATYGSKQTPLGVDAIMEMLK